MIFNRGEQFAKIKSYSEQLSQSIQQASASYLGNNYREDIFFTEKAIKSCGRLYLELREFLFRLYEPKSPDFKRFQREIAFHMGIKVQMNEYPFLYYTITIPFLLPNQRSHSQYFKDIIAVTLFSELSFFCRENNVIPIKDSAVIFFTKQNEAYQNYFSDNDNKESKDILNVISKHLITDDDGRLCDILYKTEFTNQEPRTDIFVTDKKNFIILYNHISYCS